MSGLPLVISPLTNPVKSARLFECRGTTVFRRPSFRVDERCGSTRPGNQPAFTHRLCRHIAYRT
jgi:hypothetical protein